MVTPRRQKMVEDMQLRDLAARTQDPYVGAVRGRAGHYMRSPDLIVEEEVRAHFLHLSPAEAQRRRGSRVGGR